MSTKYFALSFFKSSKIHYYFDDPYIYFPCPDCCNSAKFDSEKTVWECESCGDSGTIVDLMQAIELNQKEKKILQSIKIYNPRDEIEKINTMLYSLSKKHNENVEVLRETIMNLISFYKDAPNE